MRGKVFVRRTPVPTHKNPNHLLLAVPPKDHILHKATGDVPPTGTTGVPMRAVPAMASQDVRAAPLQRLAGCGQSLQRIVPVTSSVLATDCRIDLAIAAFRKRSFIGASFHFELKCMQGSLLVLLLLLEGPRRSLMPEADTASRNFPATRASIRLPPASYTACVHVQCSSTRTRRLAVRDTHGAPDGRNPQQRLSFPNRSAHFRPGRVRLQPTLDLKPSRPRHVTLVTILEQHLPILTRNPARLT